MALDNSSERVVLNVGGVRHETFLDTLLSVPRSKLAKMVDKALIRGGGEYFFDRNPLVFAAILNYHRTGELHVPLDSCSPSIKRELEYWEVEEQNMEACCWVNYSAHDKTKSVVARFDPDKDGDDDDLGSPLQQKRAALWRFLDDPYSSRASTMWAWFTLFVVVVSTCVFMAETLPAVRRTKKSYTDQTIKLNGTHQLAKGLELPKPEDIEAIMYHPWSTYAALVVMDNICNGIFFVDFLLRFVSAPKTLTFLYSPLTIIELLSIVPYYVAMLIIFNVTPISYELTIMLELFFFFRSLRILRFFTLIKHFHALKVLVYTIRTSIKELLLLILILMMGVVVFACLIFYADLHDERSQFENIPMALWWALVTMTTVGYGDKVPMSVYGYIVGSLCATCGILTIALTVPIIANNFTVFYAYALARARLSEQRRVDARRKVVHQWKTLVHQRNLAGKLLNNGTTSTTIGREGEHPSEFIEMKTTMGNGTNGTGSGSEEHKSKTETAVSTANESGLNLQFMAKPESCAVELKSVKFDNSKTNHVELCLEDFPKSTMNAKTSETESNAITHNENLLRDSGSDVISMGGSECHLLAEKDVKCEGTDNHALRL